MRQHLFLQPFKQRIGIAVQKISRLRKIFGVVRWRDQPYARRGAALDLMQQARACAILKHGVFAGTQFEHFLQMRNRLTHRPCVGVRTKVLMLFVNRASVIHHTAKLMRSHLQIRITLVVTEQDVVFWMQRFDEIVLKQQRLRLGAHHRCLHANNFAHHVPNARSTVVFLKVRGDAFF